MKFMHVIKKISFMVLLSLCCINLATGAQLYSIDLKQNKGNTSLLFKVDKPVAHKVFTLTKPNRVVVDFEKTTLAFNLASAQLNSKLINKVRTGHPSPNTLRLVFEVTDAVMLKANNWGLAANKKHSFLLDLSMPVLASKSIKTSKTAAVLVKKKSALAGSKTNTLRKVIVVLDPGHGGKDPGATGPRRSAEKNVTLAIAKKLKQIIDKQPGMRAVLTRQGDYYVGLRERLNIARKYNADVFVSIHADAFINRQSNGASVFALSQSGATSEAARWLAEKENYSELGGVNLRNLDDQTGLVRTVLIDLSQTATIGASLNMGDNVLRRIHSVTKLHNAKVEQARFMVLKSPDIPSILIETGFISNPHEEYNLNNARYQYRLTESIFQGLKRYFWQYPPHGSQIEAVVNKQLHIVQQGETLKNIALTYKISPKILQKLNNMSTTRVTPGQNLMVAVG